MQWLDRVKYGSGKSGSPAVTGTINTYATCTGTATQLSLTTALSASAGDVILIHQSQGTGAGQWEINYVLADAGATLTLAYPLAYTYTTGAQCVLVPQYLDGTLSGAVTATSWNGSTGGIIALMCKESLTISGSLKVNGVAGTGARKTDTSYTPTTGGGFRGGVPATGGSNNYSYTGEGSTSAGVMGQNTANGNGGGAGKYEGSGYSQASGGGGSNGTAGQNGSGADGGIAGLAGSTSGNAGLTSMLFGGGGGGGLSTNLEAAGYGGSGGGIILLFSKNITVSGDIQVIGGGAQNTEQITDATKTGGGGAGGSILVKCQTGVFGTNKLNANNTTTYTNTSNGGVGRIHIDYSDTISGTTTPTLDSTQVTTLKSQIYGGMI